VNGRIFNRSSQPSFLGMATSSTRGVSGMPGYLQHRNFLQCSFSLFSARLGHHLAIHRANKRKTGVILGRKVVSMRSMKSEGRCRREGGSSKNQSVSFSLHRSERLARSHYSGPVHNLGTQDGTYLVSNAVVHNCGAPISPKFGEMVITCEYCGSGSPWATVGGRAS